MYRLLRPLLFLLEPEASHHLTFSSLNLLYHLPGMPTMVRACFRERTPALPVTLMGLQFRNPIGLAAGLDKNAQYIPLLSNLGFGFLEVGTVTPRAQAGNPRPRLFRLPRQHALINRMGLNNVGLETFLKNLRTTDRVCPLGVNLGKNHDTPLERAREDYLQGLRAVYPLADYIAVNVSSPTAPGMRALQAQEHLEDLLRALNTERAALEKMHRRSVPVALKIAPDLSDEQIAAIARLVIKHHFDAVIATNTTVVRPGLEGEPLAKEPGGLSGGPLKALSTALIRKLYKHLEGKVPIIGVGGIENAEDAWEKLVAGAELVQVYTALIYQGPQIVRHIIQGLDQKRIACGSATLSQAIIHRRQNR